MAAIKKSEKKATKKAAGKKAPAKKAASGNRYSPAASASVEREMKAMEQGKLRTRAGDTVTNPKQAIAIGLSEARRSGAELPPAPGRSEAKKKSAAKKTPSKKATKKAATKKSVGNR